MKKLVTTFSLFIFLLISGQAIADGQGYVTISPAQPTQTGDKIEVLEVFWYACPHCFDFEPHISKWLESKPDDVEFRRMPGIFRKNWIPHAKAYFTAQKLDVLEKIHTPLFDAIHKQKKNIHDDDDFEDFFAKQSVDEDAFTKAYESEEVETMVKQAYVMGQRYKLTGVPAVIVNGKYMVSGSTAGSFENVLTVINQLIEKEREEMSASE
jgi:thiol:disulfide interchange protein DsbA